MNTSHYPSLELCKKLTEIGFPDTEFIIWEYNWRTKIWWNAETNDIFFCPSIMEMLDVMPEWLFIYRLKKAKTWNYKLWRAYTVSTINCKDISNNKTSWDTLPNALAEMILWLHENKHITFTK